MRHGLSNALILSHVMDFNAATAALPYAGAAVCMLPTLGGVGAQDRAFALADELAMLSRRCGLAHWMRDFGGPEDPLPMVAVNAMKQARLLVNNPHPLIEADALALYRQAF